MRNILIVLCLAFGTAAAQAAGGASAPAASRPAANAQQYSVEDSMIGDLIDDPAAAAVIDKYVPGFSKNPEVELARGMTLRQIQPYSADTFTDKVLESIDADLAKLPKK